ncbi:hypothetical protein B5F07_15460 [Lachnoclostridium sp. An169]|uniref:hypothetical protein n=1 Tax=Lachnoclostridium sp. An169 TaxID=1965569 RepID=UPI000B38FF9E|nr:hypothetical protein [Lachnoclostridium sp. An169]OUP81989.1 hypothetical protein B5F07_15460 [Lachnoclostridium sp. An169]
MDYRSDVLSRIAMATALPLRSTTGLHGNTRQNSLEFDMDVKKSILKFSTKDLKGKIRKIKKFEERENDESEINRRLK